MKKKTIYYCPVIVWHGKHEGEQSMWCKCVSRERAEYEAEYLRQQYDPKEAEIIIIEK